MGWEIGFDDKWKRDIGYGVPAFCDHPGCTEKIDRGLAYVCGGEPYGGDRGCGLFFCYTHLRMTSKGQLCKKCKNGKQPFEPKREHPDWINWKLTDPSWEQWRNENPEEVKKLKSV